LKDFTLDTYRELLLCLIRKNYSFQTFADFLVSPEDRVVVLRHDVDRCPQKSLQLAALEQENGIKATYYFRIVKKSFDKEIISKIANLGHEIGYHYECLPKTSGDQKKAIEEFAKNLQILREIWSVKTISMHGSPASKYDSHDMWKRYNYRDYGIIGEPYFDLDWSRILYLTDTGRRWDGDCVNVRDKNISKQGKENKFHKTFDIINAVEKKSLPNHIMINTHPHRWSNFGFCWIKEMVLQNGKNIIKYFLANRTNNE
jgi:hypothetical protein